MTSQNLLQKNGLMVLWTLFPFAKAKTNPFAGSEPETGGQFRLYENYPNQFSTITIIYFALMHASKVQITVADLTGNKVMTLINEDMEAGIQRVPLYREMHGVKLTSGNYIYQLSVSNENGTFIQSKVILVL